MSRYWPPIIPSVACESSRATCGVSYDVASRNASASSASPARIPVASPNCFHVEGCPRRSSSSSSAGRSSWTSENVCTSSSAQPAGSVVPAARARSLGRGEADHRPDALAADRDRVAHRLGLPVQRGQSSSPSRYSSTSGRSSSGLLRHRPPLRASRARAPPRPPSRAPTARRGSRARAPASRLPAGRACRARPAPPRASRGAPPPWSASLLCHVTSPPLARSCQECRSRVFQRRRMRSALRA